MGVVIKENKLVIIREPKNNHFDLLKDVNTNLKHEINFIIKDNKFLAEHTTKNEGSQLLSKYKHGNIFMNTENSKMNEPEKFTLNLLHRWDLKAQINMLLFKTYLFITRGKNLMQKCKNTKLKMITWNAKN